MTDAQFTILVSVIGAGLSGMVGVLKWAVTRLTKSLDTNTQAHLASVKAMTEMSTKLDFVYNATAKVEDFIKEEISGVHSVPDEVTPVERKSKGQYFQSRAKTNPGER